MNMETKIFYRVSDIVNEEGLWYNIKGEFTGLIHTKYDFCTNSKLPMPYDPNVVGYLSAVDKLEDILFWFTKEDIAKLEEHSIKICVYQASDYKKYENHWIINQKSSILKVTLPVKSI